MSSSKVRRLISRLLSGDISWLLHQVRLAFGHRRPVPRPEPLVSQLGLIEESKGRQGPLKVLVFSHNLDREGASISLKELICGLKERHAVDPEVIAFGSGPLRSEYVAKGIAVEVLPSMLHRISTTDRLELELKLLEKRIRASSPDVVLVNTLLNFPAVLAAERACVPSVWNPRESEPWGGYFRFLPDPVAQRAIAAIGLPKKVVFVAEATRAVWKDFEHAADFLVIHNSLNLDRFFSQISGDKAAIRSSFGWAKGEVVFLCVGTLCERKGQQDALHALEGIADLLKVPVRLVFVGDASGPYGQAQQRFAVRFQRDERIHIEFVESTMEIGDHYRAADVFLLCSRVESYPRVVLEAMAFGLPIISTPVFGVKEQLPEPTDACFYEPGDTHAMGEGMLEMANIPLSRNRLGLRSKARFAEMPTFDQMLQAYEAVLKRAGQYGSGRCARTLQHSHK